MIVVSDTSPIINLAAIGRLDILATLYGQILIPDAVYMEIVLAGAGLPGADDVRAASWIETRSIADLTLASGLQLELDRGEAEAISLAVDTHADLLLMDERRGRKAAARIGVPVLGLLGVVVHAKRLGLLPAVRPILDALVSQAGFYIGDDLYRHVLTASGE